jgi:AcrR family transcriptional regulator
MPVADLKPRSVPQQARSRATMERLLAVSAELLEEVGVDGFNTNLLAERAEVGARAIYRYFPNKLAILVAVAEQVREPERAWIGDLREIASRDTWRAAVDRSVDSYFAAASTHRGYVALRIASQAIPALRAIDRQDNERLGADLAQGLARLGADLEPAKLRAVCQVVIESAGRVLDVALQSPAPAGQLLVSELKHMLINLLADYLD